MNAALSEPKEVFVVVGDLTIRELEVLCLLGQGKAKKEITQMTGESRKEVEYHCTSIQQKLNLQDGVALLRFAAQWVIWRFSMPPASKDSICPTPLL